MHLASEERPLRKRVNEKHPEKQPESEERQLEKRARDSSTKQTFSCFDVAPHVNAPRAHDEPCPCSQDPGKPKQQIKNRTKLNAFKPSGH
jgi:hypothetical protein